MLIIFSNHTTQNHKHVTWFYDSFVEKIAAKRNIVVISIRNISIKRPLLFFEKNNLFISIELSCFFLPQNMNNSILTLTNYFISHIAYFFIQKRIGNTPIKGVHQVGFFHPIGYYFAKYLGTKCIMQIIGTDNLTLMSTKGIKKRISKDENVFFTSNSKEIAKSFLLQRTKYKVIYRGIELNSVRNNEENIIDNIENNKIKIYYGGGFPDYKIRHQNIRHYDYKGGLSLIEVLTKFSEFEVIITGPNIEIGEKYAKENKCFNILFLGYVSHERNLQLIKEADIIVIPSYNEGISNIAMEAMLARKLVISRNVGGMSELIFDKINGLLFDTNKELFDLLKKFQTKDRNYIEQKYGTIMNNAKKHIYDHFDNNNMINSYIDLYNELF